MFIYDIGNVYSCPYDHTIKSMAHKMDVTNDDEGKGYKTDWISHRKFEDRYYDPMACRPFYQDREAPIWYGRVDRLGPLNQKLFVYGFVTNHEKVELEFELEYKMLIRAKMMDDEHWIYLNEFESFTTHKVTCDGEEDLCGRAFSTGFLPEL